MSVELCKDTGDKRDYVYFIALGYYRLKVSISQCYNSGIIILRQEHDDALKFIELALKMEPNNSQAKELKQLIQRKQNQGKCCWLVHHSIFDCRLDNMIGLAVVGGAAAVAVGATALAGFVFQKIFK